MSRNQLVIDAPVREVWAVLADAHRYADWVVGAKEVRVVEGDWPTPGSSFGHRIGLPAPLGLLSLTDETKVGAAVPEERLVLHVEIGPLGSAEVELVLEEDVHRPRTTVRMRERPTSGPIRWFNNPVQERAFWVRNLLSLAKLKLIVEHEAGGAHDRALEWAGR